MVAGSGKHRRHSWEPGWAACALGFVEYVVDCSDEPVVHVPKGALPSKSIPGALHNCLSWGLKWSARQLPGYLSASLQPRPSVQSGAAGAPGQTTIDTWNVQYCSSAPSSGRQLLMTLPMPMEPRESQQGVFAFASVTSCMIIMWQSQQSQGCC